MSDKVEIKRGTKVEDDTPLEVGKFAVMLASPPKQEVEGQYYYGSYTQCPWCGHVGYTRGISTDVWQSVICGYCGRRFRA